MKSIVLRKSRLASRRIPAAIAAFVFLVNSVLPAGYAQSLKAETPIVSAAPALKAAWDRLQIPEALGRVESVYAAPGAPPEAPFVIHIQDAHAHPEAQYHIDGILEDLRARGLIANVFVEGAEGLLQPNILMVSDRDEVNLAVADYLINKGELTGAERFALKTKGRFPVIGVEDPDLYQESYGIFTQVKQHRQELRAALDAYARQIEKIEIAALPREIHEYVIRSSQWHKHEESSFAYFELLARYSLKYLGLNFSDPQLQFDWPSFVRLMALQKMDQEMRPEVSLKELGTVLAALEKKASELQGAEKEKAGFVIEQTRRLFKADAELKGFSSGRFPELKSVRSLMEQLYRDCKRAGLELLLYPEFRRRAGLLILREELDAGLLFSEIERIENRLEDAMAVTPEQRNVLSLSRDFRVLEKMLGLTAGREEFDRFSARRDQFQPGTFRERILSLSGNRSQSVLPVFSAELLDQSARFYELARRRDQVLVDKTLEKAGSKAAVLISGGFHSRGITEILRERGIPHAVVAPKMTQPGDDSLYEKVMLGQTIESPPENIPAASSALVRWLLMSSEDLGGLDPSVRRALLGSAVRGGPGSVPTPASSRSELRAASDAPTLRQAVDNLSADRNLQAVESALRGFKEEMDREFQEAQSSRPNLTRSDFFWDAIAPQEESSVRDVPKIEELFRKHYKSAGIERLPLPYRAAFVLRALDADEFAAVQRALREAYSAAPYDPSSPSENITPETYARLSKKFSEAVNRDRIRENLLIREMLKRFVFLLPAGADRALEKENLVNQLISELEKPGSGRVPTHVFLTDLHGSTRVGALIAYALGIDNYADISSPEELERRLVDDWTNKNPGVPAKTVREILEERNTLIVGGSDYVDRGPKPYWGFRFNKWLRDNGILKFINGNHDLWKDWNVIGMHLRVNDTLRSIADSGKHAQSDLDENLNRVRRFVTTAGWDSEADKQKFVDTENALRNTMSTLMEAMREGPVKDEVIEYYADQIIDLGNNANHSLEWWAREWGIHGGWFDTFLDQINEELINAAVDGANKALQQSKEQLLRSLTGDRALPQGLRDYAARVVERLNADKPVFDRVEASAFAAGDEVQTLKKEIERIKNKNAEIRSENEKLAAAGRFSEMVFQLKVPSTFDLTSEVARRQIQNIRETLQALNNIVPGLNLPVPAAELVTQQNYRSNPAVVETALWNWKNFRLLYTDVYDNLYVHGIIPVDPDKGDFRVAYTNPEGRTFKGIAAIERIQFEVRSFFEQYDTLPDSVEFRDDLDRRLGGAFQVLNEWYSDVLGLLKPESIKTFLKSRADVNYPFGAGYDFSPRDFDGLQGVMHVGHVERAKLLKQNISYWAGGMSGGLVHGDFEMSEGYSGLGAMISWFYRDKTGNLSGASRRGYRESVSFYKNQIKEKEKKLSEVRSALEAARQAAAEAGQISSLESEERKLTASITRLREQRDSLEKAGERITDITFHEDLLQGDAEQLQDFVGGGDLSRYYVDRFLRENQEVYSRLQGEAESQNLPDRARFYAERADETKEKLRRFRHEEANRLKETLKSKLGSQGFDFSKLDVALRSDDYRTASAELGQLVQAGTEFQPETKAILDQFRRALDLFSSRSSKPTELQPETAQPSSLAYDPKKNPLLAAKPAKIALNLGAYRMGSRGRRTTVIASNFDLSEKYVVNTLPNRVLDYFLRDLVGDPNFSVTDIYGVESAAKFAAFLRGNIAHGPFRVDQLDESSEGPITVFTLNGHRIRIHKTPVRADDLGGEIDYVIDFSDSDFTRETPQLRSNRLKALTRGKKVKKVFSVGGDGGVLKSLSFPGLNDESWTQASNKEVPLASPMTFAAAQVLDVIRGYFPDEFEAYSSVVVSRPKSGDAGHINFNQSGDFGTALKTLFPELVPAAQGPQVTSLEYDAPKGAGNLRMILTPKPGSRFASLKTLTGDQLKPVVEALKKEVNGAFEKAAQSKNAPYLRYAGEEFLNSLTGIRDPHAVVFDSQATAVLEGGNLEIYVHVNDRGYAAAMKTLLRSMLLADASSLTDNERKEFESKVSRGVWPAGTIAPNKVEENTRFMPVGREIGFGIIGVRGRIGKQLHQLLTGDSNYVPEFWIGVQDIDTLIQQFREDVAQGPMDVARDGRTYTLEKGVGDLEGKVLLKDLENGNYLQHPKTKQPLAIPYYSLSKGPGETQEAFTERMRARLGHDLDKVEVIFNAGGFALAKDDPYYDAFLRGKNLKRIIMTAPAKGPVDVTVVRGVNEDKLVQSILDGDPGEVIFCSGASCTTNALARPLIEFNDILSKMGSAPESVRFVTHHAITPSQGGLFGAPSAGKSLRTANDPRMSAMPEDTGANKVVTQVAAQFKGRLSGTSHRDANHAGSLLIVTAYVSLAPNSGSPALTVETINQAFQERALSPELQGILAYRPGVASTAHVAGVRETALFLPEHTRVEAAPSGFSVTIVLGYDNEVGYSNAVVKIERIAARAQPRSELRSDGEPSGGSPDFPSELKTFLRDKLAIEFDALQHNQQKTLAALKEWVGLMNRSVALTDSNLEAIRGWFVTENLSSPESLLRALLEGGMAEPSFIKGYRPEDSALVPYDRRHGYFLELIKSFVKTGIGPSDEADSLKALALEKIQAILKIDQTYHVVLSAIPVMTWIGQKAVVDLVKYAQPYQDGVVQREAKAALKALRAVSEPELVRGIMEQRDERARNYLADLLAGLFKEYTPSPPPEISNAAREVFVPDEALRSRITALLNGKWPTHLQFLGSTLFLPAGTENASKLRDARLKEIEAFKQSVGVTEFAKLTKDWGFDAVSHWASKASFSQRREILQFLLDLSTEDTRESPMKIAIRSSQAGQSAAHTRKLLQVLLEGSVLTRDGGSEVFGLILENPVQSRSLIAFITVMLRLDPPDSSENGNAEKLISKLLHAGIAEVYPLIFRLAESIPHANHLGVASGGGSIREPILKVDELFGRRDTVFHYLRLEFHRDPSTSDLSLMGEMLQLMVDLHAGRSETPIPDSEIERRLGTLVRPEAHEDVFRALRESGDVARAAYFIDREIKNQGGSGTDNVAYLLDHPPTWEGFSEEEKSEKAFLAAKQLIETYAALRARYGANSSGPQNMISAEMRALSEEHGDHARVLRELSQMEAEAMRSLLKIEESWEEGDYTIDFKRHIVDDGEWGFLNVGFYGWYDERKFNLFQKIRAIRLYSERLHDRQLKKAADLRRSGRNFSEAIRELLIGMRLLIEQAGLQGIKTDEFKKNLQVLESEALDARQVQNVIAKMQEETLRIYDFINSNYADYPGPVALSLGRAGVAPRFNRDSDASLPDAGWAARVQETLLADMTAEERSVSTLRRYMEELSASLAEMPESGNADWRLEPILSISEDETSLLTSPRSEGSNTGTLRDFGGKGMGLMDYLREGYPVPAFIVLSSRLPAKVQLEVKDREFRMWVLKAILDLERQTSRVFPFSMESLEELERAEIQRFREQYEFNTNAPPLSLSARSGSFFSMPGMMDTLLNLPIDPRRLGENAERFDLDNYRSYLSAYGISHLSLDARTFSDAVDGVKSEAAGRLRVEANDVTIEMLNNQEIREVIRKFEVIVRRRAPQFALSDPFGQVLGAVIDIYNSWDSEHAQNYRKQFGISDRWGTAVILQQMVYGNKSGNSGTAVVISSDPAMGRAGRLSGVWKYNAQGPELVGGMTGHYMAISKDDGGEASLEVQNPDLFEKIRRIAERLDREKGPQDIEITVQDGQVYLLQSRPMVGAKGNGKKIVMPEYPPVSVSGIPVAPGAVAGRVINGRGMDAAKLKETVSKMRKNMDGRGEQDLGIILVTDYVNDDVAGALVEIHNDLGGLGIAGIINNKVGLSSHAGLIARRLGIVYVSDVDGLAFNEVTGAASIAKTRLDWGLEGAILTIDGYPQGSSVSSGRVFLGKLDVQPIEPKSPSRSELRTETSEKSKVRLQEIQNFLDDRQHAVWLTLYEGVRETVTYANPKFLETFGKNKEGVVGKNYAEINRPGAPIEQYKHDDARAMQEGFFIATEGGVKVVKIAFEGGVLGMFVDAQLSGNNLEPELVETLKTAWPDFPRVRALAALQDLGIAPVGAEMERLDSVYNVAQYASQKISQALAGQNLFELKQHFEDLLRRGLTTYQGEIDINDALRQLSDIQSGTPDAFANHITNFVVEQIRSFDPSLPRSELRRADLGRLSDPDLAAPYLALNYGDRRWVAVHLTQGIFGVIPSALETAVREAIQRVLTKSLFPGRSEASTTARQALINLIRGQAASAQAGLEISILKSVPASVEEHLLAASLALASNPEGHIHEMLLGVSSGDAERIQAAFNEDPAFALMRGRYKVSAVTAQNLSFKIREAAAAVYNQAKAKTDAGTLAEFLQSRVTISSAERDLLVQTLSHSGWLVHDNLAAGEALRSVRLAQSMKLASGQLRAELIRELGQILAVRKVISADSLMADLDLGLIQRLWARAIAEQTIYSAA